MRALVLVLLFAAALPAVADPPATDAAHLHYEKAEAAYALGNYAKAADEFEQAFELKPDPAILYNAAQAHRIGGNKTRALLLYQNLSARLRQPRDERRRRRAARRRAAAGHRHRGEVEELPCRWERARPASR